MPPKTNKGGDARPRPLPAPSPQRVETRAVLAHGARVPPDTGTPSQHLRDLHVLASRLVGFFSSRGAASLRRLRTFQHLISLFNMLF